MSEILLRAIREPGLSLDLQLQPGLHAFLGSSTDGLPRLFELMTGVASPRAGSVLLDGKTPFKSPKLRQRIGTLCPLETLPPAISVRQSLALVLSLMGASSSADDCLERCQLSQIADSPPDRLSIAETRSVALGLALTLESPALLALCTPLSGHLLSHEFVRTRLNQEAKNCPVVLFVQDPRELRGLEVNVHVICNGRLRRSFTEQDHSEAGRWTELPGRGLTVVTREASSLAAVLREKAEGSPIQVFESTFAVVLYGAPLLELSEHVLQASASGEFPIIAIQHETATLAEVQAMASRPPQGAPSRPHRDAVPATSATNVGAEPA